MKVWNDTDIPLAYLITFRTYGTWLHGDERGSIDRYHNRYGGPRVAPNQALVKQHAAKLKGHPVILTAEQRNLVESAIREVCDHREWILRAINVRTNHVHWCCIFRQGAQQFQIVCDKKNEAKRILATRAQPVG